MKTKISFIVADDIKSLLELSLPVRWCETVMVAEGAIALCERVTMIPYTYIAYLVVNKESLFVMLGKREFQYFILKLNTP